MFTLRNMLQEIKDRFNRNEAEIKHIEEDIAQRDLEHTDPLPKMAKDVEKLRRIKGEIKELMNLIDQLQMELAAKQAMFQSADTEKRLQSLLENIKKAQEN